MNLSQLKGYISEEIAKYHMQKLEYTVVPIGREKIDPDLSDLLLFIRGNMGYFNTEAKNSFQLFERTISKLPDFALWKITTSSEKANVMSFKFLEVKYRTNVLKLTKHASEDKYSLNIQKSNDNNELLVHKYIENLSSLFRVSTDNQKNSINDIEFYIYLITLIEGRHTPLIGKIIPSTYSDYFTYLYTPEQFAKNADLKLNWGNDYDVIANFFMQENKLDTIFSNNFLIPLLGKTNHQIAHAVFEFLNR